MEKQNKSSNYILQYLEEAYPNKIPLSKIDEYELGMLAGQQLLIEKLKIKLHILEEKEQEVK